MFFFVFGTELPAVRTRSVWKLSVWNWQLCKLMPAPVVRRLGEKLYRVGGDYVNSLHERNLHISSKSRVHLASFGGIIIEFPVH